MTNSTAALLREAANALDDLSRKQGAPAEVANELRAAWVEVEKAKSNAYEDAARICEEMSYPPDGQAEWHGTDNQWAAIKLEDAAKAIRERKAMVCHVTQAAKP